MKLHIANAAVAIAFAAASLLVAAQPVRNYSNQAVANTANNDVTTNISDWAQLEARESYDVKGTYIDTQLTAYEGFGTPTSSGYRSLTCVVSKNALMVNPGSAHVSASVDLNSPSCSTSGFIYYYATDTWVDWRYSGVLAIAADWHQAAFKYDGVNKTHYVDTVTGSSFTQTCSRDGGNTANGAFTVGANTHPFVANWAWYNFFETSVCNQS